MPNHKENLGFELGEGQQVDVESLAAFFAHTPRAAIAFSGGCDSSYLIAAALEEGCKVKAFGVKTAFQPDFEIEDSLRLVDELGVEFELIEADVFAHDDICANGVNRCYFCKTFIFSTIQERMKEDGFEVLLDGTNASDSPMTRPGFQALAKLGVVSPLRRAGMTKDDVRAASEKHGLFTAYKPSFSCLAAQVPRGESISPKSLFEVCERLDRKNA